MCDWVEGCQRTGWGRVGRLVTENVWKGCPIDVYYSTDVLIILITEVDSSLPVGDPHHSQWCREPWTPGWGGACLPWSQWMPYLPSMQVSQAVPPKPSPHSHMPVPFTPSKQTPFPKQTFWVFPGQGWHWGPKKPAQHSLVCNARTRQGLDKAVPPTSGFVWLQCRRPAGGTGCVSQSSQPPGRRGCENP